jgi:hypothetical protein
MKIHLLKHNTIVQKYNHKKDIIPDISYHLIFCFISFRKLPIIAQCCKEWNRIVTSSSFFHLYKLKEDNNRLSDASLLLRSPFRFAITHLRFEVDNLAILNQLSSFPRLVDLHILIEKAKYTRKHNFKSFFQSLPKSLRVLELSGDYGCVDFPILPFFKTLPSLIQLDTLILGSIGKHKIDFTFLQHMKNLKVFKMPIISMMSDLQHTQLINACRSLPLLSELYTPELFHLSQKRAITNLRQLCAQPGAPKLLETFSGRLEVAEDELDEVEYLLSQLPSLQRIDDYNLSYNRMVPFQLSKWIDSMSAFCRHFTDVDISRLVDMKHLSSLTIGNCILTTDQIHNLLSGLSSQLVILRLRNDKMRPSTCTISFQLIAKCAKLQKIELEGHSSGLLLDDFYLLKSCTNLQNIFIWRCGFIMSDLTLGMQKELEIPSQFIPTLQKISITS